jgi:flagellin-like protein
VNPKRRDRKKMKILKSKKALSPVVASIILIAVTVAVSIAVAAWMGALTFSFMGSSSITITNVTFETGGFINITAKNTGTNQVTITTIKVNNAVCETFTPNPVQMSAGNVTTIKITKAWESGNPYKIDLYDSSGSAVGSTQANAPGA